MSPKGHAVLFVMGKNGHVAPCVPLVKELVSRDWRVTVHTTPAFEAAFEGAGAATARCDPLVEDNVVWNSFLTDADKEALQANPRLSGRLERSAGVFRATAEIMPQLLEKYRDQPASRPSLVLIDPQCLWGKVLARVLAVPCASVNSFIGPGSRVLWDNAFDPDLANFEVLKGQSQELAKLYGVDSLATDRIMRHWGDLNLCISLEVLAPPLDDGHDALVKASGAKFVFTGPLAAGKSDGGSTLSDEDQALLAEVKAAKESGKLVVLCAFGTNVTSGAHWGKGQAFEAQRPHMGAGKSGTAGPGMFGRRWCHTVWKLLADGFGEKDDAVVVLGVGKEPDAMPEGFTFPSNFIVRKFLPQKELLPLTACFICHGGANSIQEGLLRQIPMIVMPYFGDQFENGESIERLGVGAYVDCPTNNTADELVAVVREVATNPQYKVKAAERAQEAEESLKQTGGVSRAADCLEELAAGRL
eukprot:TRINITY_DN6943_c0_g1_i1.p1 TRINITY_DN6943_c0_g1~~TRINITY_DN6943_c0_g1_i1.p1  ORF type:complete len:499 (-),score=133.07 TRINITY_DN6943_c0_g1_i1:429-1847(-)